MNYQHYIKSAVILLGVNLMSEARERSLEEVLRKVNDLHRAYANRPREMFLGLHEFILLHIRPILLEIDARDREKLYQATARIVELEHEIRILKGGDSIS